MAVGRGGPCDNCGRPPAPDEDPFREWGLLLLIVPLPAGEMFEGLVCPRCAITLRAMLFVKWNGRKHSGQFRPYKPTEDADDDDEDLAVDPDGAGGARGGVLAVVSAGVPGPDHAADPRPADPVGVPAS